MGTVYYAFMKRTVEGDDAFAAVVQQNHDEYNAALCEKRSKGAKVAFESTYEAPTRRGFLVGLYVIMKHAEDATQAHALASDAQQKLEAELREALSGCAKK